MPLGKRVVIPVRVSEPMADAIDVARGEVPRSAWIEEAINARLGGLAEVQTSPRVAAGTAVFHEPGGVPVVSAEVPEIPAVRKKARNCKHERMRITKGVCPDCGEWVTK